MARDNVKAWKVTKRSKKHIFTEEKDPSYVISPVVPSFCPPMFKVFEVILHLVAEGVALV